MRVEADGGEILWCACDIVSWRAPQELDYESDMDPKIALWRSRYANSAELASLNATYFTPGMPMRNLGHVARHVEGTTGRGGSERYAFKHEGVFFSTSTFYRLLGSGFLFLILRWRC